MDIIGKENNPKQLPVAEEAVAFLEETCHTSTEATTAIWPFEERRRLWMCHQRCYYAKYRDIATCRLPQHLGQTKGPLGLSHHCYILV